MSDPWTEAWEEAEASVPPGVLIFYTLELQHPSFVEDSVPFVVRIVTGVFEDQVFTIENTAEYNPGEDVTFSAVEFYAERPELSEGKPPTCNIVVDNVVELLSPYLEAATQYRADMIAVYREYRNDDTSEPCYGPVEFVIKKIIVKI